MFYYKTAYLKIKQNLTLKCGHPPLCEGGNSYLYIQGNLQMQPFARRCTKRLQQQCHFFYTQDKQDKLMAVRKQHFTLWLTDRSLALPDKQELPPLSFFLCSLSDVSIHKTKKTSLLRSSAFVHQLSEGPVLLNYSSCIVVFLTETVKVTLLSPTVLKALHVPCDDSCRRRELWRHSSQLGSKSRDVDV